MWWAEAGSGQRKSGHSARALEGPSNFLGGPVLPLSQEKHPGVLRPRPLQTRCLTFRQLKIPDTPKLIELKIPTWQEGLLASGFFSQLSGA